MRPNTQKMPHDTQTQTFPIVVVVVVSERCNSLGRTAWIWSALGWQPPPPQQQHLTAQHREEEKKRPSDQQRRSAYTFALANERARASEKETLWPSNGTHTFSHPKHMRVL